MPDDVTDLLMSLRNATLAQQDAVMERAGNALGGIYADLEPYMLALSEASAGIPNITPDQFQNLEAYKLLMKEIDRQLDNYQGYLQIEYGAAVNQLVNGGEEDARKLLEKLLGPGVVAGLTPEQIAALIAQIKSEGHDYLEELVKETKKEVRGSLKDTILKAGGIAGLILTFKDVIGKFLVSIVRFLKTAQINAYRKAMLEALIANNKNVAGWIWFADLDDVCCLSCVALHGTIHTLNETLDDHPNGRCIMMPITNLDTNIQSGEDWFKSLTPEEQQALMGPGKYEKWKNGEITFNQFIGENKADDTHPHYYSETPLKDL